MANELNQTGREGWDEAEIVDLEPLDMRERGHIRDLLSLQSGTSVKE